MRQSLRFALGFRLFHFFEQFAAGLAQQLMQQLLGNFLLIFAAFKQNEAVLMFGKGYLRILHLQLQGNYHLNAFGLRVESIDLGLQHLGQEHVPCRAGVVHQPVALGVGKHVF